jgi:hypothetical protein
MTDLSRRKLILTGLAATAGVSGLGVAARIAQRYGLVPPDHGGMYGLGETLTYASQRLLTFTTPSTFIACLPCEPRVRADLLALPITG